MSTQARMNRLFGADGRCFQIAVDHALFNQYELLEGVEQIDRVILQAVEGEVDALLLSPGGAKRLQRLHVDKKPSLVLRADVSNVYDPRRPDYGFSQLLTGSVERALRLDAAAIVLNFFFVPDNPQIYHQCLSNICAVQPDCQRYGMPLMVEPLVLVNDPRLGCYTLSGDLRYLLPLHRQAVELGVDILKADPTDSVEEYHRMVEVTQGVPLLPRGGGRVDEKEILERTSALIRAGASGVVYGRNVFQHENPPAMIRALKAAVHGDFAPSTE